MKKAIILGVVFVLAGVIGAHAQTEVQFPIDELGGCASRDACRAFCDNTVNKDICISFAKAHTAVTLDQQRQLDQRDKLLNLIKTQGGPGGCTTEDACKAYCSDPAHAAECRAFAESVSRALRGEATTTPSKPNQPPPPFPKAPGGCSSEDSCHAYCAVHIDECLKFVMANLRACQMPPGLKNNPNGIPDNFRNMGSTTPREKPLGSTTPPKLPPPPPKPEPITSQSNNRSFLGNIFYSIFGR